ncbi:hypothetical protein CYMTET_22805 [Cymbomonas tetramitiformis]|uniref:Uncharacterized protein n=1 Tax=Cymbomonas tetramitiformis TaxID=36881 RepID=A0AAE0FZH3_9CHLO|nr:hypothetical protein CYMTET_22805 [Cymbomonas tetramitiformis]
MPPTPRRSTPLVLADSTKDITEDSPEASAPAPSTRTPAAKPKRARAKAKELLVLPSSSDEDECVMDGDDTDGSPPDSQNPKRPKTREEKTKARQASNSMRKTAEFQGMLNPLIELLKTEGEKARAFQAELFHKSEQNRMEQQYMFLKAQGRPCPEPLFMQAARAQGVLAEAAKLEAAEAAKLEAAKAEAATVASAAKDAASAPPARTPTQQAPLADSVPTEAPSPVPYTGYPTGCTLFSARGGLCWSHYRSPSRMPAARKARRTRSSIVGQRVFMPLMTTSRQSRLANMHRRALRNPVNHPTVFSEVAMLHESLVLSGNVFMPCAGTRGFANAVHTLYRTEIESVYTQDCDTSFPGLDNYGDCLAEVGLRERGFTSLLCSPPFLIADLILAWAVGQDLDIVCLHVAGDYWSNASPYRRAFLAPYEHNEEAEVDAAHSGQYKSLIAQVRAESFWDAKQERDPTQASIHLPLLYWRK